MNDTQLTVVGNLVDDPRTRNTKNGHAVTNFRVASTSRRYDQEQGKWVDAQTLFVNVTCWRAQAENVARSLRKGQPVVVTGRYYQREYIVEDNRRVGYELEASAVGHDLTRGTATFTKAWRPAGDTVPVDDSGAPVDDSQEWIELNRRAQAPGPDGFPAPDLQYGAPAGDELAQAARPLTPVG